MKPITKESAMKKNCETCMYRVVNKDGAPCNRCKNIPHPGMILRTFDYWRWSGKRETKKECE